MTQSAAWPDLQVASIETSSDTIQASQSGSGSQVWMHNVRLYDRSESTGSRIMRTLLIAEGAALSCTTALIAE
jgi:hypothetical protein